jgi:hypothetical protein
MLLAAAALLTTALLASTLTSALSDSHLYGCLLSKSGYVCPNTVSPFHLICSPTNYVDAQDACLAYGWRLAVLDDDNKFEALWQVRNCTPGNAWVASFNGVEAEGKGGCFQFRGDVPIVETDLGKCYCRDQAQAVLCEDVPVEVITETSYISTTTTDGTKTKTKVVEPTCPHLHCRPHKPHHSDSEFVILKERLPYAQAECACNQLHLKLADLNIRNFLDASYELWHELGASKHAWVRSWNGDKYGEGTCLALWTGSSGPNGAIAQPVSCEERIPVVCQKPHCPACPCKQEQHGCHCIRPHRNVLIQAEQDNVQPAKPIFASKKEQSDYDQKVEAIKKSQSLAVGKEEAAAKPSPQDIGEYDQEEEVKCVQGHGPCPKVCKYYAKGIRIVKANATAYQADDICRRFGWTLLDYKECQEKEVKYLREKCCGAKDGLWIRSYNGADGGACMLIDGGESAAAPVGWVLSADDCLALGGKSVLCQTDEEPVYTTSGTFVGSITYTTTTVEDTKTKTSYTATVTTTVTLLQD